jgi:toxin ParE1/3/4
MPEPRYVLSARAVGDLEALWLWIATHASPEQADAVLDTLGERFALLAGAPRLGRERPELGAHVRSLVVDPLVVFYRPRDWGAQVIRVLHTAQDIERQAEEGGFADAG